jgi:glycosyltransferase involved in cell wall biosynthesis
VAKLLKRLVAAPLRPPVRGATLFLLSPLRRLARAWRRRNRLVRRVRGTRKWLRRLRRKLQKALRNVWRRQVKQRVWLRIWRIHLWRKGERPVESGKQIHLISSLVRLHTGNALRTLHLYDELKDHAEVSLWTERHWVPPEIAQRYPVKRIVPERFEFPKTGTFVFVGTRPPIGPWHRHTYPRRIILIHNSDRLTLRQFHRKLRQLSNGGRREVEVAYASELTKRMAGNHPGYVQPSLIDLERFIPTDSKPSDSPSGTFTVGRMSRANPKKHHPEDGALYRRLLEEGCRVRIMGPSPALEAQLGGLESVELLPMGAQEAPLFLQSLDCFFYRTSEKWSEPWGRVVTEAMACGLAVVCHNRGGYAEAIEHGRNGFLFESQQEALEILLLLKEDPALRERVGKEARRTAERLFSGDRRSELVEFYLR